MLLELSQPMLLWRREEVKELLSNSHRTWPPGIQPFGYLQCYDLSMPPHAQAERALRHLERCC
jgi:hypothetical protein